MPGMALYAASKAFVTSFLLLSIMKRKEKGFVFLLAAPGKWILRLQREPQKEEFHKKRGL